jgi:peroxiredoxin
MGMKASRSIILIAIFAAAMAVFALAQETGSVPPDFSASDIAGKAVKLSDLRGKVVLLDFWATWCPPCRVEVPNLIRIFRQFRDKSFVLISVSLDRDLDAARAFVRDKGMNWVHIINADAAREIAEKYQVEYIPSTFVIDRSGRVAASHLRGSDLKDKIADLLR